MNDIVLKKNMSVEGGIVLIIPAYEPDERLPSLLNKLPTEYFTKVLVINDGSCCKYEPIFEDVKKIPNVIVLKHYKNMGKGRALKTAFNFALNEFPCMIGAVTADSDGQHSVADIIRISGELKKSPKKLILGSRNFSGGEIPVKSKFGNNITKQICSILYGLKLSDTQTGLRGIPTEFMESCLNVVGERFEFETNMLIASQNKISITEIPIETIYDSKENHQTHFNPIKDSLRIYKIFATRLLSFLLSSLSSCGVDIICFYIFSILFKSAFEINYLIVANIFARLISATYNYLINYNIVFSSCEKHSHALFKYILVAFFILVASTSGLNLAVRFFPSVSSVFLKVIVDIVLFILSFILQRCFVFKNN